MKAQHIAEVATNSLAWHQGYRAACKEICERFGLDNTDEIELLVKNGVEKDDAIDRLVKQVSRLEIELQAAQKDQELFRVFAVDFNDLRAQVLIKDGEIARLMLKVEELHNVLDDFKALRRLMDITKIGRKLPL